MLLSPKIKAYVEQEFLTLEQAMGLSFSEIANLESEPIRGLIVDGSLTLEQAMGLSSSERYNLESEPIRGLIVDGTLTLEQAKELNLSEIANLESEPIRSLIADGTLTLEQAKGLSLSEIANLESESIRGLIANETLTLEQAMGLSHSERYNLESEPIRSLIDDGTLTLEQAMGLNDEGRTALNNEHTRQRLRNGQFTIQNIMGGQIPQGGQGIPALVNINDSQSTHTASVHRTVSESAKRLLNRYATIMNPTVLDEVITTVTETINALPNGNSKNEAAKRCVARLAAPEYVYTDLTSGVNTRELLALSWLAINDDTMRTGGLEDATRQVIEGLYEIQRGYNLSETGTDLQGADVSICSAGTFNKLLEKLNGVHSDVVIEVIIPNLAALKLPMVIKEEVKNYLAARANPATFSEFVQFTHQITQIKEKGVEVIWESIKDSVAARMFDEFGSLYANQDDPRFVAFIDAGQYVELGQLPSFQKEVSESEGYRKYCSSMMKSYRMFSQNQCQDSDSSPSDDDTDIPKL